jgi:hypothetical protein
MSNNVHYLDASHKELATALDTIKADLISGEITDIVITGINSDGNMIHMSSVGSNLISLLGAMHFATDCISSYLGMNVDLTAGSEE